MPPEGEWEVVATLSYDGNNQSIVGPIQFDRPDARRLRMIRLQEDATDTTEQKFISGVTFDNFDIGLIYAAEVDFDNLAGEFVEVEGVEPTVVNGADFENDGRSCEYTYFMLGVPDGKRFYRAVIR